ncbi:MAG: excisionase [Coriobacteriia bacterium]|nr:excisionase [Coriobacteriia bacterium]
MENPEYLPIGVGIHKDRLRKDLNKWFKNRAIPASRQDLRNALEAIDISDIDCLLVKSMALSLSDQYWINPNGELEWKDVNFFDNSFSDDIGDIFFGKPVANKENINFMSPDNTSDGWLKKRWQIIDEKRCLIKGGSDPFVQEPVNEVFASEILSRCNNVSYVNYSFLVIDDKPYSVCENFITPDTELVTANQIMLSAKKPNHISNYDHLLNQCSVLGISGMKEHLDTMLAFDSLIMNEDRHYGNFGVIRDVNTLKFVGVAPIFDSGSSLWYNSLEKDISLTPDFKTKPFHELPSKQLELVSSFDSFDLEKLKGVERIFDETLSQSSRISSERKELLVSAFAARVDKFVNMIEAQKSPQKTQVSIKQQSRSLGDRLNSAEKSSQAQKPNKVPKNPNLGR